MAGSQRRCAKCSTTPSVAPAAGWAVGRTPMTAGQSLCGDCHSKLRGRAALRWLRGGAPGPAAA